MDSGKRDHSRWAAVRTIGVELWGGVGVKGERRQAAWGKKGLAMRAREGGWQTWAYATCPTCIPQIHKPDACLEHVPAIVK